jgi:DNA methylase.
VNISIRNGNVLDELKKIPDNSVDCIITSPPYYGLRNYGAFNVVWDDDPDCEHEWIKKSEKQHSGRGDSQKSRKYSEQDNILDMKIEYQYCSKCNAWKGELGQEPSYKLYLQHLLQITKELKRVLKPTGTMFWNIGDSYASSGGPSRHFG